MSAPQRKWSYQKTHGMKTPLVAAPWHRVFTPSTERRRRWRRRGGAGGGWRGPAFALEHAASSKCRHFRWIKDGVKATWFLCNDVLCSCKWRAVIQVALKCWHNASEILRWPGQHFSQWFACTGGRLQGEPSSGGHGAASRLRERFVASWL